MLIKLVIDKLSTTNTLAYNISAVMKAKCFIKFVPGEEKKEGDHIEDHGVLHPVVGVIKLSRTVI